MPRISEFFGIAVYMYWLDIQKHHVPHVHVRYSGSEAVFDLDGNCLEGELGTRVNRLVKEWCQESKNDLNQAWKQALLGKEVPWIKPLV